MGLGFDWDGDGRESMADDMVTMHLLEKEKKAGKNSGCCGTGAVSVLAVPALVIGVILRAKGIF